MPSSFIFRTGLLRLRLVDASASIGWLIACVTLMRLGLAATMPLTPQEAYYWTWSRFVDWSYFDHPPLASHGIALTTLLLGQTSFAIKSAAVLWSLGWNLLWARLVLDMFGDRRLAFWSLLAINLTLLYEFYGVGATPDAPLMFGWIGAIWAVWRASATGRGAWWLVAGLFGGLAMLGKYPGVLLLSVMVLYVLAVPAQRHWLRRPQPYLAVVLAALVFLPVVVWNARHEWVSLAFQSSRRLGEMQGLKPRFFVLLLATQFLLLTPYLFAVSLHAMWRSVRAWVDRRIAPAELLLLLSALVPLVVFVAASFRSNAKINWLLPAWWSLIVLGMRHGLDRGGQRRLRAWGLASSASLLVATIAIATVPNLPLPGDLNIWSGWRDAAQRVDLAVAAERHAGRRAFVFSPNYKISSLLWFHRPSQERTYAQDIFGRKALQYDYFPQTEDLVGATGFLVVSDQAQSTLQVDAIRPLFESLERVDVIEVGALERRTRRIEIWRGTGYRGRPQHPHGAVDLPDDAAS
ncbi:glycosyltransferase family 39 protein [Variovorax sp. J22R133]|uniref:glycosyltransferase family 39 protein n=1 Tax=Variovorax brevis TaxID=3053503 RepID=UPI002574F803|nr:glycosyltransferase family 39 protein [Variovorax sp. J22R133]MDM0111374.1 glycosyltransferase family 39 protein [Variovorax sp. J22R133]